MYENGLDEFIKCNYCTFLIAPLSLQSNINSAFFLFLQLFSGILWVRYHHPVLSVRRMRLWDCVWSTVIALEDSQGISLLVSSHSTEYTPFLLIALLSEITDLLKSVLVFFGYCNKIQLGGLNQHKFILSRGQKFKLSLMELTQRVSGDYPQPKWPSQMIQNNLPS